ncbi:MAG: general secretion pathway protein GspB [Stagnimonas sp.]|nr:general secretion pathway protein GspB [Stagnimonas sp.]
MSLILDALKKAEQDRHAGQAPVLDEMLVRRAPPAARRRDPQQDVLLVAAILFAVLFALAGLTYWFWPSAAPTPATVAASTAAPATDQPAAQDNTPAPALRIDPERLEAPVADVPEEPVGSTDTGAAQAMTMDELDGDAPEPSSSKSSQYEPPTPPVVAEAAPAPTTPTPAPAIVASTPPQDNSAVRPLKEMPPAFRSEFPKLVVDVHVYDENPLRRFVLVNGKKYRETDTLMEGPRVLEITPVGVVVEQRGSKVLVELPR